MPFQFVALPCYRLTLCTVRLRIESLEWVIPSCERLVDGIYIMFRMAAVCFVVSIRTFFRFDMLSRLMS